MCIRDRFKTYYSTFERLAASVGEKNPDLFKLALQAPQVMVATTLDREDSEDWGQVSLVLEEALSHFTIHWQLGLGALLLLVVLLAPNGLTSVLQRLQRKSQP